LRLICLWLSFMGFLHVWCFRFNDMAHMFEKLTRVDILFLADFLFRFHCWTFFFKKKKWFYGFLQFLFYWVISISWPRSWVLWINLGWLAPYYPSYMSSTLSQVDSYYFLSDFMHTKVCFSSYLDFFLEKNNYFFTIVAFFIFFRNHKINLLNPIGTITRVNYFSYLF